MRRDDPAITRHVVHVSKAKGGPRDRFVIWARNPSDAIDQAAARYRRHHRYLPAHEPLAASVAGLMVTR